MGYGKNLKTVADAYGISLRKLGLMTGISPQTLYGAVKRDNGLRYDHALRLADILAISPDLICRHTPADADKKAKEHIKRTMKQLADAGKKEFICRQVQILMTYDHEHLAVVERLLKRFGSMDLSEWVFVKNIIEVILRHHSVRRDRENEKSRREENMDWRKELEKTVGVTDEKNVADFTDMEGREILDEDHLSYLKTIAADEQRTDKG